jgi:hypothetical protein
MLHDVQEHLAKPVFRSGTYVFMPPVFPTPVERDFIRTMKKKDYLAKRLR